MESLLESLISAVRSEPCLWNPLHNNYRDSTLKEGAWLNVVEVINHKSISNVKVAKTEWKRLRDNHRDALKRAKLGKNKLLPAQITTWKYAKAMQFLEPYMKYRITENIEMEPLKTTNNLNCDQDVSTTDVSDKVSVRLSPQSKKRPRPATPPVNSNSDRVNSNAQHTDALDAFFNCIRQSTREMPVWLQTHVKKKIFAVIIEAEEIMSNQAHLSDNVATASNRGEASEEMQITIKDEFVNDEYEDDSH